MKKEKFMKNGHPYEIRDISDENGIKVQIFDEITGKPVGASQPIPPMTFEQASDIRNSYQDPIEMLFTIWKSEFLENKGAFLDLSKLA
jgi:hypothetical protein